MAGILQQPPLRQIDVTPAVLDDSDDSDDSEKYVLFEHDTFEKPEKTPKSTKTPHVII